MTTWLLALIAGTLGLALTSHVHTTYFIERLTMTQQAQIDALVAQLRKAYGELSDRIMAAADNIVAQVAAGATAETLDLSALTAVAQDLDDLTPDAPAVELVTEDGDILATVDVDTDEAEEVDAELDDTEAVDEPAEDGDAE